jgi:hypothetical protein
MKANQKLNKKAHITFLRLIGQTARLLLLTVFCFLPPYYPYLFQQTCDVSIGSMDDPPDAIRLLEHPMKIIVRIPGILLPYTAYPPIVSNIDRRLTDGAGASPPRLSPIKQGKVIDTSSMRSETCSSSYFWTFQTRVPDHCHKFCKDPCFYKTPSSMC